MYRKLENRREGREVYGGMERIIWKMEDRRETYGRMKDREEDSETGREMYGGLERVRER